MPKARLELARPCEHCHLKTACIPFHHFGTGEDGVIIPGPGGVVKGVPAEERAGKREKGLTNKSLCLTNGGLCLILGTKEVWPAPAAGRLRRPPTASARILRQHPTRPR